MSKNNRKLNAQVKKLREVLEDALRELEVLCVAVASDNIKKGINILDAIEKDNEERRDGE